MGRLAIRGNLLLSPLLRHKGRFALSVLAIAIGVALGYAVQLVNQAAVNEFSAAVQTLSGEADLLVRGARTGFDEALYPRLAKLPEVAVASPVVEVDARLTVSAREVLQRKDFAQMTSAEIAEAKRLGLELIVCDHHQNPAVRPPALAVLNPVVADAGFPFTGLSAAGVVFYLLMGTRMLLRETGGAVPDLRRYLDLVALGTVADLVPLLEHRAREPVSGRAEALLRAA